MDVSQYPKLSLTECTELLLDSISSGHPTLILSPPGTGKTALAIALTDMLRGMTGIPYEYAPLEIGLTVPEEIGGVPTREASGLVRLALANVKRACEVPCVLHADEVTRGDATRQGALMTGVNERRFGDAVLHPQTIVVATGNEPDSGGVYTILDALLNRFCVVRMETTVEETCAYLAKLGSEGSTLRRLGEDYALTAQARPTLVQNTPPEGHSESGALWASGRAIVNGLRRLAGRIDRLKASDEEINEHRVAFTHLAGCIGLENAAAWFTLRKLRGKLPTRDEIVNDAKTVRTPPDFESAIAALPLLIEVERVSPDAAWLYLSRFGDNIAEIQAVAARNMQGSAAKLKNPQALRAFNTLAAKVSRSMSAR